MVNMLTTRQETIVAALARIQTQRERTIESMLARPFALMPLFCDLLDSMHTREMLLAREFSAIERRRLSVWDSIPTVDFF